MKKFYKKIIWGFFSAPRHAAEWAEQNEYRITAVIAISFLYMLLGLLFGYLPSWEIK